MLDLRQVQAFVAVVEHQSFTRAAERLHIGQSGLSAQVRKLERRIGYDLFDRSGGQVTTTPAGEHLYRAAQQVLAAAERFDRLAGTASTSPVVRLAIAENGVNALTVDVLSRLRVALPDTDLEMHRVTLRDQHDAVALDFDGVIARPPYAGELPQDVTELTIAVDPLVLVIHETSPEATRASLSVDEVLELPRLPLPWLPLSWSHRYPVFGPPPASTAVASMAAVPGAVGSFREAMATASIERVGCVMPVSFASTYNLADLVALPIDDIEPMPVVLLARPGADQSFGARLLEVLDRLEPRTLPLARTGS